MAEAGFLIDVDKCTGCRLCIVACKDEHVGSEYPPWTRPQPETGQFWVDVLALERGAAPRLRVSFLPLLCQHCRNAPCIKACPEGAIKTRPDGLVWIDAAACTGCGLCQDACPYDVIYMNEELDIAQKCTGCGHRVDRGEEPRCAEVCPHEAIVFAPQAAAAEGAEVYHPEYNADPLVAWRGLPRPWIAGTVIDASAEEVLEGVTVSALDLFEGAAASVRSDGFGDFWLKGLQPDRKYRVEIEADGYRPVRSVVTTRGDQDLGTVGLERLADPPV